MMCKEERAIVDIIDKAKETIYDKHTKFIYEERPSRRLNNPI